MAVQEAVASAAVVFFVLCFVFLFFLGVLFGCVFGVCFDGATGVEPRGPRIKQTTSGTPYRVILRSRKS